jgi:hypothetical protein
MRLASGLVLLAALSGCASYSPPVRSPTYGAPGRLRQGDLEIAGAVAGVVAPGDAGGGWLAYAVRDWASVELGVDASIGRWAMGFLGGRFTHAPKRDRKLHGALDGEVGVGMGAGGNAHCSNYSTSCDPRSWHERVAFGSYLGGGAGYHFSFFALYARGRVQQTVSDGLPATVWGTLHGGLQFRIARTVDLFGGTGLSGFIAGKPSILTSGPPTSASPSTSTSAAAGASPRPAAASACACRARCATSAARAPQNTATPPAHVNPAPKAAISTREPSLILPSRHDSLRPIGIVAAVVLP